MNRNEIVEVFYGKAGYFLGLDYLTKKHPDNSRLRSCYEGTNIRDLVQCIMFDKRKRVFKLDRYLKRPRRFILISNSGEIIGVMVAMSLPEFYQKVGYEDYAVIGAETTSGYREFLKHPALAGRVEIVAFDAKQAQLVASMFSVKKVHYWSIFAYRGGTFAHSRVNIRLMGTGDFGLAKQLSKELVESSPLRSLSLQLKGLPYKNYVLSFDSAAPIFIGVCPSSTGVYQIDYLVVLPADRALLPVAIETVARVIKGSGCELIWKIKTEDVSERKSLVRQAGFVRVFDERHLHLEGRLDASPKRNQSTNVRSMVMRAKTEANDACEEFEQEIGPDTTFVFPQNISEHDVLGKRLIIAPEYANWLVCNEEEYRAFWLMREGKSLQEVWKDLCEQGISADKATTIISQVAGQILGKEFERKAVITEKEILKAATLFITAGCNLRCSTCVFGATVAGMNECTLVDWKRFLEAFVSIGGQIVTLTGGEPMTNPNFEKILVFASEIGLRVVVITNATLINEENVRLLGSRCDEVQVSIDGPNEETHDSVRSKGTFKRAVAGLKKLSTYPDCRLSIAMTPTFATLPIFQTELHRFAKWVRENIREDISIRVSRRLGKGRKIPSLSLSEQEAYRKAVIALCDDQLEKGFSDKLDAAAITPNRRKVGCGIGDFLTITADGEIKLCDFFSESFGNIKSLGTSANLLGVVARKIEELACSFRAEELSPCNRCDLRYFCGGKCRKDNKRDCGDSRVCKCEDEYKASWYEKLVRISPYIVQPLQV